ncbi:MAG: hypothetical protein DWQ37_05975 [Planctomycetota bacterium]|mgnify:CR=1 FL=1|nr:MAG: hypothetical protein DWQ37_05975 [Planctomycetota bacterium]
MAPQTVAPHRQTVPPLVAPPRALQSTREEIRFRALTHMLAAVAATPAQSRPFPHVFIEGLFPADLYEEMLAWLPEPELYEAFSYEKHATDGQSNRGCFKMTRESLSRLPERGRWLWQGVRDALGSPEFKSAVFDRLSEGLAYRFGVSREEAACTPGYALPELFRETTGYRIKPHPDTRRKLVTMQIALAQNDRQQQVGTEFYSRSLNPMAMLREPRGFDVVKRMPFLPNVAYAFVVINTLRLRSWHGRTTLEGPCGVRNTILNIWYARAEDGNPELMG